MILKRIYEKNHCREKGARDFPGRKAICLAWFIGVIFLRRQSWEIMVLRIRTQNWPFSAFLCTFLANIIWNMILLNVRTLRGWTTPLAVAPDILDSLPASIHITGHEAQRKTRWPLWTVSWWLYNYWTRPTPDTVTAKHLCRSLWAAVKVWWKSLRRRRETLEQICLQRRHQMPVGQIQPCLKLPTDSYTVNNFSTGVQ